MKKLVVIGSILFVVFALAYMLFGNKENVTQKIDPAFTGYISGFTSGVISKEAEIVIHLREEVALDKQTDDIAESLFDFDPNLLDQNRLSRETPIFEP